MSPTETSYLFAPSYRRFASERSTEGFWQIWRYQEHQRFAAGICHHKDEAAKAIREIRKLNPNSTFQVEFVGQNIYHHQD